MESSIIIKDRWERKGLLGFFRNLQTIDMCEFRRYKRNNIGGKQALCKQAWEMVLNAKWSELLWFLQCKKQ